MRIGNCCLAAAGHSLQLQGMHPVPQYLYIRKSSKRARAYYRHIMFKNNDNARFDRSYSSSTSSTIIYLLLANHGVIFYD
jgi:hypothetical protein